MITLIKPLLCHIAIVGLALGFTCPSHADSSQADPRSLENKVFCGYQGWFSAPGDGAGIGYDNYNYETVFAPGTCVIDYWPDLSEFGDSEKYPTNFHHQDGTTAHVFSAANPSTVDRHFRWMKQYGIDGIFLQRFGWALKHPKTLKHRDQVLENVKQAAAKQHRLWALMYDLSSLHAGDIENYVIPDIRRIAAKEALASELCYAKYNGKPVVAIWGIGFNDNRAYSLRECEKLVRFLKHDPVCGGLSVMLGVPYYWREQKQDTVADEHFHEIVKQADVVSPWSVGRYRTMKQAQQLMTEQLLSDIRWTKKHDVGYMPVIFPGFSWHNLTTAEGAPKPLNEIPRQGGQFLWSQAKQVRDAGHNMVYVAMFDEMNEGTCIFKCTDNPPIGASPFLSYAIDGLPSDHYLWLAGKIGQLMRGEVPASQHPPTREQEKSQ